MWLEKYWIINFFLREIIFDGGNSTESNEFFIVECDRKSSKVNGHQQGVP